MKPMDGNYITNEKMSRTCDKHFQVKFLSVGQTLLNLVAGGKGLEEAEVGREAHSTTTFNNSENEKLAITIKTEKLMEKVIQDRKNGDCVGCNFHTSRKVC